MKAYPRRSRTRNENRRRKLVEQKLMGLSLLVLSGLFLWMVRRTGEGAAAFLVIAPLGLLLLFSKNVMIV